MEGDLEDRDHLWALEFAMVEPEYGRQDKLPMLNADVLIWLWILTKRIVQKGDSVVVAITLHEDEPTHLDPNDVITVEYTGNHTYFDFEAPWSAVKPRDTLCDTGLLDAGLTPCTTFYASLALVEEKESNESERVCDQDRCDQSDRPGV
jgi:hypothetical protein